MANQETLMTIHDVAAYFKLSVGYTRSDVVTQTGFPPPTYATSRRAHPRWHRADIEKWARQRRKVA